MTASKHVVKTGKTTVLTSEQARELLDSIDVMTLVGLRDRALIAVMTSPSRASARGRRDARRGLFSQGQALVGAAARERRQAPRNAGAHNLEAYLDAYIVRDSGKAPLFRSAVGRTGALTEKPMHRVDAWRMVQRWASSTRR